MYNSLRKKLKSFSEREGFIPNEKLICSEIEDAFTRFHQSVSCNAYSFNTVNLKKSVLIFEPNKTNINASDEDVYNWILFMNECGFPCSITEEKNSFFIKLAGNDYASVTHYKVGLTMIRLLWYAYPSRTPSYEKIAKKAIDLFIEDTALTPHEALCKAHSKLSSYTCTAHCVGNNVRVLTKHEMIEISKKQDRVNNVYAK